MAGTRDLPTIAVELRKTVEPSHLSMAATVAVIRTQIILGIARERMCRVREHHRTRHLKTAYGTMVLVVRRMFPRTDLTRIVRCRRRTMHPQRGRTPLR